MGRFAAAGAALALVAAGVAGCGGTDPVPLAEGCTASAQGIVKGLAKVPGTVLLEDGTPLSRCVADGLDDGDLQTVGITFTQAAERLRPGARTDPVAALQLGYLVGVVQKGASRTNGVMAELQRRLEVVAGRTEEQASPAAAAAIERGLAAGKARG